MPPKKEVAKGGGGGGEEVTFTVRIKAVPTELTEASTTAYDAQISLQFFGEDAEETLDFVSSWDTSEWSKEYLRHVDKDMLFKIEQHGVFHVKVAEKSCPFNFAAMGEEGAAAPAKGKGL